DAWLSASRSRRWADLVAAWWSADLAVEDHLVARRPARRAGAARREAASRDATPAGARPLAGRRLAAAATRRRAQLQVLVDPSPPTGGGVDNPEQPGLGSATLPLRGASLGEVGLPHAAVGVAGLARLLAWRRPMVWPDPAGGGPDELESTVRAVLDAAAFLGV